MAATISIGSAAAATVPLSSGAPAEVSNPGRGLILSTISYATGALQLTGIELELTTQTIVDRPYPGLQIPQVGSSLAELRQNVTSQGGPPLCLGSSDFLFDRLELVVVQWGFNVIAIGERLGSGAPSGAEGVLISVRDVRLQSCGVPVPVTAAAIEGEEARVEMLVLLPEAVVEDRRWGYGDVTPFRCVRWFSSGIGRPGIWSPEGCSNVYRAKEDAAVGDKAGLDEGVLRCRCTSFLPGTWAVEIVPGPLGSNRGVGVFALKRLGRREIGYTLGSSTDFADWRVEIASYRMLHGLQYGNFSSGVESRHDSWVNRWSDEFFDRHWPLLLVMEFSLDLLRHFMPSAKVEKYRFRGMAKKAAVASVSFENICLELPSGEKILEDVNGEFRAGRMCAILGPSGAGKTSLMNVLCGKANYAYVSGRVCFNGQEGTYEDYKTVMGFVPQDDVVHEAKEKLSEAKHSSLAAVARHLLPRHNLFE
eukprot:s412_g7.t1